MKRTLSAIIIIGTLAVGSFVVGASFAENFGNEVRSGTILTANHSESEFPYLSRISYVRAIETALRAVNGKLLDIGLEDENGFLVWEVDIVGPRGMANSVKIDAGDGRLLASGRDDDEEERGELKDEDQSWYSRWKFWEKDKGRQEKDSK